MAAKITMSRSVWYGGKLFKERQAYEVGKDIEQKHAEHALLHDVADMAEGESVVEKTKGTLTTENTPLVSKGKR